MKTSRSLALAVVLVAALTPAAARAQLPFLIDFEALASPTTVIDIQSTEFSVDPRLTNNGVGVLTFSTNATQGFASWGNSPSDPFDGYDNYTGSTAIFAALPNIQVNIQPLDSRFSFTLNSIDVAPLFAPSTLGLATIPSFQVQFLGRTVGSSTFFSQLFTIPASTGRPTYSRLNFDARFTNLAQVAFFQRAYVSPTTACTLDQCTFQFDNVTGVLAPEPGTLGLLGAGLAGLAAVARRRRRPRAA
jgi:hypothetical protein